MLPNSVEDTRTPKPDDARMKDGLRSKQCCITEATLAPKPGAHSGARWYHPTDAADL